MILIAGLGVFLAGPAQTYGVAVFVDPMLEEFGWSRSVISTAYAFGTLVGAGGVVLSGRLLDRFGHRNVMTAAGLCFGAALVVMSLTANPVTLALGFALLRGAGIGAVLLASRTLVSQWYVRRRGRALSLAAVGGALSLALVPATNTLLIDMLGWRTTWQLNALVIWLVFVPTVALFVRDRPEQIGQFPDGRPFSPADGTATPDALDFAWRPAEAMRTRVFWLLVGASIVPGFVVTGLDFNQVSILAGQGLPEHATAIVFTTSALVTLPASLLAGQFIDRWSVRYVLVAGQALLAGALIWLMFVSAIEQVVVYGVLRGLALGCWAVAIDASWPAYFGRRYLGGIRGMTFSAEIVGAAAGPIPFGVVRDLTGSYDVVIVGATILPMVATAAMLTARAPGHPPHALTAGEGSLGARAQRTRSLKRWWRASR
jgi:MFS family permease